MKSLFLSGLISAGLLVSCSAKDTHLTNISFKQLNGTTELPSAGYIEAEENLLYYPKTVSYKGYTVDKGQQYINDLELSDARVHKIKGKKYSYIRGKYLEERPSFRKKAQNLVLKKDSILEQLEKRFPEYKNSSVRYKVQLRSLNAVPFLSVRFLSREQMSVVEYVVDGNANVILNKKIAHHFDAEARVVEHKDKKVLYSDTFIKSLLGDGTLSGKKVYVNSEVGNQAYNAGNVFKFAPEDKEFNEVQAYYFANKFMTWVKDKFSIELPFTLAITAHFDGVNATSASFYFDQKVFLGDGDGVSFKNMPQDPTIVIHEVSHAYVTHLSGLSFEGVPGSFNEAFSDFFTAAYLETPYMGKYSYLKAPYKRSLANTKIAYKDFKGDGYRYNNSLVISGTFWDIKKAIGKVSSIDLAIKTLILLGPSPGFDDFRGVVSDALESSSLSEKNKKKVMDVLDKRGWVASKSSGTQSI